MDLVPFLSLWYDPIWDWTQVARAIGEHSNRYANAYSFNIFFFFLSYILYFFIYLLIWVFFFLY